MTIILRHSSNDDVDDDEDDKARRVRTTFLKNLTLNKNFN